MGTDTSYRITADTSSFQAEVERARAVMSGMTGAAELGKSALEALGIGFGVFEVKEFISGALEAAEKLDLISKKTSIAVEQLDGLSLAAKQSGSDLDSIAQSINKLAVNMGKDAEKFAALGITAKDPLKAFEQLADIFSAIQDPQLKAALGAETLGKSWGGAAPLLAEGGQRIQEMVDKGHQLSGMTGETARSSHELNDRIAEFGAATQGFKNSVLSSMLPSLTELSKTILQAKIDSGTLMAGWVALGGVGSMLFTDNMLSPIQKLDKAIAGVKDQMQGYNPFSVFGSSMQDLKTKLADLESQRQTIVAKQRADEDAQAITEKKREEKRAKDAKDAEERARRFLENKAAADSYIATYNALVAQINKYNDQLDLQDRLGRALTEGEKLQIEVREKLSRQDAIDQQAALDRAKTTEYDISLRKELAKALDDISKGYQATIDDQNKEIASLVDETQKIRDHNAELVGGVAALDAIKSARMDDSIAILQHELDLLPSIDQESAYADGIRNTIAALNDRKKALGEQITANAIHTQQEEWKKFTDQIEQSLTDALMAGFNSGKSFSQNFVDSLKHTLETTTLKVAVQAIVSPAMGTLQSAMGMTGSSTNSLLSTGSSAATAFSGASSLMTAGNLFGPAGSVGSLGPSGLVTAAAPVYDATGALVSAGSSAGIMGTLSAAAPYVAAALVIANAIGAFGKGGGPQVGQYGTQTSSGYNAAYTMSGGDTLGNQALSGSVMSQIAALAAYAGKSAADIAIGQGYKLDPQGTSLGLAYRDIYGPNGTIISGGGGLSNPGWTGSSSDASGAANYLGTLHTNELQALIQSLGDPKLEAVSQALMANFGELEKSLPTFLTAQAMQKSLSESMMTDAEKLQAQTEDLKTAFANLGIAVPATVEDFRNLVATLPLTTQAGQNELLALQKIGPEFLQVAQATTTATGVIAAATRSLTDIANERKNLQDQLDNLTMTSTQLLQKQRDALDASNQSLFDQVQAATAAKSMADAAMAAASASSAAQVQIANQKRALDIQLMQATGNTLGAIAAQHADALAALDPSLRATQQAIWDATDAANAQAQAAQDAAAATAAQAAASTLAAQAALQARQQLDAMSQSITSTINTLLGTTGSGAMNYSMAKSSLSAMLSELIAGGPGPDQASLNDMLAGIKISTSSYSTKQDYQREVMGTAGMLQTLNTMINSQGSSNADVVGELQAMRAENAALRSDIADIKATNKKTADLLLRVTQDGNSLQTTVVA